LRLKVASRIGFRRLHCLAGAVLAMAGMFAAEPKTGTAWRARVWHADDGLPDNRVTGVTQTPDGALWVATRGGLVRFNGSTFEEFDLAAIAGVVGNGLRAMYSDSRGNLWLGAYREAVLRVGRDSADVFTTANGIPVGQFSDFAEDADGTVWLAFGGRVCRLDGSRFRELVLPEGVGAGGRASLTRDGRGQVWCAFYGRVGVLRAGRFEPRFRLEGRDVDLASARKGGLWACAGSQIYGSSLFSVG